MRLEEPPSTSARTKDALLDPENEYLEGLRHDPLGLLISAEVDDHGRQQGLVQDGLGLMDDVGGVGRICLLGVGDRSGAGGSLSEVTRSLSTESLLSGDFSTRSVHEAFVSLSSSAG